MRKMHQVDFRLTSGHALFAAATLFCLGCGHAAGQSAPVQKKGWEATAAAGLTLTRGNSETLLANLSLEAKRKWVHDETAWGVTGGYGEAKIGGDAQKNTEYIRGFGQYNRLFNERLYGGLRLDGEYDGIAGVDYRFRVSPLFGYYVIKHPRTTLGLETGPSVVFEDLQTAPAKTYVGVRFGERFEHKLTSTARVWQSLEYIPNVERWDEKYLLVGELGIDTAVTKKLSLRAVIQDNYDSQPAQGRKNNDVRLITGLAYKF